MSGAKGVNAEKTHGNQIDAYENMNLNSREDPGDEFGKVDITQIDLNKRLSECLTLLEFLIISLSKELSLKPKQAIGLLANGNKYLAVGLIKGLKTSFTPMCNWLQNVYVNIKTVMGFIEKNNADLFRFLEIIKPGLQSSSEQVAQWASRIISKISFEVSNTDILPQAYQWFVKDKGGLQSCIYCLKRHKSIKTNVVQIITQIARHNLSDLFVVQMRRLFDDNKEYMRYVAFIFPTLIEMPSYKDELQQNRVLDFWIEQALKMADYDPMKNTVGDRQVTLSFLCDCWISYPKHLTENLQISNTLLDLLKKGSRDYSEVLKLISLTLLFHLLESFAEQKNPNTALIYKKLTFSLIENSSDTNLREFMLRNFAQAFKKFPSMPPDILLDPLIKQIQLRHQGNIFEMNVCDIEFFIAVSNNSNLNLKTAIQMTDMISKMYLHELVWSQSLIAPLKSFVQRFVENEPFQEYLQKLAEVALQMIRDSYKRLLKQPGRFQQDYTSEQEQVIMEAQRRALIIELMKAVLDQQVPDLNNQIKGLLVKTQQELLQSGIQYKGLFTLLAYFGDPNEVVAAYKNEEELAKYDEEKQYEHFLLKQNQLNKISKFSNQQVGNRLSDSEAKMLPIKSNYEIDWGENVQSQPFLKAKINNFTALKDSTSYSENNPQTNKSIQNPKGVNRMDFSQYESNLLQSLNRKGDQSNPIRVRGREMIEGDRRTILGGDSMEDNQKNKDIQIRSLSVIKRSNGIGLDRRKDELEQIREKREKRFLVEDLKKMQSAQRGMALQKLSDNELNKINTKLNVGKGKQKDQEAQLEFKENDLNSIKNLNKYKIMDLNDLEERDRDSLDIVIKQYTNTFKYVFSKYCNTHKTFIKNAESFADKKHISELISFSDIWSCCKEYQLHNFANKEDVLNIMKQVNSNPQFTFLKLSDFVQFLIQLSIFMFKSPPRDLRGLPLGNSVKETFSLMAEQSKRKGENTAIFEHPECFSGNLDVQTIRIWNNKLLKDPEIPLPENLKKVTEKSYVIENKFTDKYLFGLSKSYSIAYQIVADILREKLGVQLFENQMKIVQVLQVRPKPIPKMFERGKKSGAKMPNEEVFGRVDSQKEFAAGGASLNRNTSPNLKNQKKQNQSVNVLKVSRSAKDYKESDNQYQSLWVQKYSQYGLAGISKGKPKVVNQIVQERQRKEEDEQKKRESKDKRLKERKIQLDELKKDMESHKAKKASEKREKEEKEQQDKLKEKERQDQARLEMQKRKEVLKKYKEEEDSKKQQEKEEQVKKNLSAEAKNKTQFAEVKQKQNNKISILLEQLKQKKETGDQDKRKEQEKIENLKKVHLAKNEKTKRAEKIRKERIQEFKDSLVTLSQNPEIIGIFTQNSKSLTTVFTLYEDSKSKNVGQQLLSYRGFNQMCTHFKLMPDVVSSEEVQQLYNACIRENTDGTQSIRFDQFEQLLLRIAVKGQPFFDTVTISSQSNIQNNNQLKRKSNEQPKGIIELYSQQDLQYLKATSPTTLQGLINYLQLPPDKVNLLAKIKAFQGEPNPLNNPERIQTLQKVSSVSSLQEERSKNLGAKSKSSKNILPKKLPQSNKYKNVKSKFQRGSQGDIFSSINQSQQPNQLE